MRLLDQENNATTRDILILLRLSEAQELLDTLNYLLQKDCTAHCHLNSEEYTHEISIALYKDDELNLFGDRIRKLITDDI